jgi:hypothetical protein
MVWDLLSCRHRALESSMDLLGWAGLGVLLLVCHFRADVWLVSVWVLSTAGRSDSSATLGSVTTGRSLLIVRVHSLDLDRRITSHNTLSCKCETLLWSQGHLSLVRFLPLLWLGFGRLPSGPLIEAVLLLLSPLILAQKSDVFQRWRQILTV